MTRLAQEQEQPLEVLVATSVTRRLCPRVPRVQAADIGGDHSWGPRVGIAAHIHIFFWTGILFSL